jgi:addiction module RelE/StbE family toxin
MVVLLAPDAQQDFDRLPVTIRARVLKILERLRQWPEVSGAKALSGDWVGHYRMRTGDWRVIFRVITPNLIVVRIRHRSQVYGD